MRNANAERIHAMRLGLGLAAALLLTALLWLAATGEAQRMAAAEAGFAARSIENGAAIYASACAGCHGVAGRGVPELAPPLNDAAFFAEQMARLGYAGDLRSYVEAAVLAGRPPSSDRYRSAMPPFGDAFGGPLRPDQVRDVASFVLNWLAAPTPTPVAPAVAPAEDTAVALGAALYGSLDCLGCHGWPGRGGITGPDLAGIAAWGGRRMPGLDAQAYIRVSLLAPSAFIAPECPTGPCPDMMPRDYYARLTPREIELLVRYLLSLDEAPPATRPPAAPSPLVGGLAPPRPTPAAPADRGRALYEAHCIMCHGDRGQGGLGSALSAVLVSVDPWRYARATTAQGVPGMMPAFDRALGGPLTEEELDQVAAYVVEMVRAGR
ncbi:MAG: c-type cytochrome [Caldilineales bacterium]|nr:c-type cytochrome [Caldilineales bacterium]MDW8319628.1 c-type cytochrome [Anaerolineae bacterium]